MRSQLAERSRARSLLYRRRSARARNTLLKWLAISSESNENNVGVFDRCPFRRRYVRSREQSATYAGVLPIS